MYLNESDIRKIEEEEGTYLLDLHRLLYISHLIAQRLYSTYYPSATFHMPGRVMSSVYEPEDIAGLKRI
jgi:hypothetical protein